MVFRVKGASTLNCSPGTPNRSRPACPAWPTCAWTRSASGRPFAAEAAVSTRRTARTAPGRRPDAPTARPDGASPALQPPATGRPTSMSNHRYGDTRAADALTLDLPPGCMVGFIGPDGVGKSTWLGLVAGARAGSSAAGSEVLGGDMADAATARASARASPTCRRAWARTSTPPCRCSRTSTSSAVCSASPRPSAAPHRRAARRDRHGRLRRPPRQQSSPAA